MSCSTLISSRRADIANSARNWSLSAWISAIDSGVAFAVGHAGRMVATQMRNGERIWSLTVPSIQQPWIAGDSVFAHAGVLEEHVKYGLDILNGEGKKWMLGAEAMMPNMLSDLGPARTLKLRGNEPYCGGVESVLADLAVKRMVIVRGPEKAEASMCDGKLLRLGPVSGDASGGAEYLEIAGDAAKFVAIPAPAK